MTDEFEVNLTLNRHCVTVCVGRKGKRWHWKCSSVVRASGPMHDNPYWQPLSREIVDGDGAMEAAITHTRNIAVGLVLRPEVRGIHEEAFLRIDQFDGCDPD